MQEAEAAKAALGAEAPEGAAFLEKCYALRSQRCLSICPHITLVPSHFLVWEIIPSFTASGLLKDHPHQPFPNLGNLAHLTSAAARSLGCMVVHKIL